MVEALVPVSDDMVSNSAYAFHVEADALLEGDLNALLDQTAELCVGAVLFDQSSETEASTPGDSDVQLDQETKEALALVHVNRPAALEKADIRFRNRKQKAPVVLASQMTGLGNLENKLSEIIRLVRLPQGLGLDAFHRSVIADRIVDEQMQTARAISLSVPFWFTREEALQKKEQYAPLADPINQFKIQYRYHEDASRTVRMFRKRINEKMGRWELGSAPELAKIARRNPVVVAELMAYALEEGLDRCFSVTEHGRATDFFIAHIAELWVGQGKPHDISGPIRSAIQEFHSNRMDGQFYEPSGSAVMHRGLSTYLNCLLDIKQVVGQPLASESNK